ncbi:nucleoside phosphorylase [Candidatus Saccharibacteria bacterium]|nr:nucleoside phosphorylase [Candidatus Saccharibacteria bacterium]
MLEEMFDDQSRAIIDPPTGDHPLAVDACLVTFSHVILKDAISRYDAKKIGFLPFVTEDLNFYLIEYAGKRFAIFRTYTGAPACVGTIEESISLISTRNYLVFGTAGCLDKSLTQGKIIIPNESYRDEGTSHHYQPTSSYIKIKNADKLAQFMADHSYPYVLGRNWTTDAFYRETVNRFAKRKDEGCISVDMECAALQALCDFRNFNFYTFFFSDDLLDAPEWDQRRTPGKHTDIRHDTRYLDIALEFVSTLD